MNLKERPNSKVVKKLGQLSHDNKFSEMTQIEAQRNRIELQKVSKLSVGSIIVKRINSNKKIYR